MPSIRPDRHWPFNTLSAISAIFSQLLCLEVSWISSRWARLWAFSGGNASYKEATGCVFKLSITRITFFAFEYLSSSISWIKQAQSIFVRRSVIFTVRFPPRGATSIKIFATPLRTYSSSINTGWLGAAAIGSWTSPINCILDSSMHTTGHCRLSGGVHRPPEYPPWPLRRPHYDLVGFSSIGWGEA